MRILVCHGYEVLPDGRLSALCESTCRTIAEVHEGYDQILVLAGQHLPGANKTVDRIMKSVLIDLGVPGEKLIAWSEVCPEQRPPRTTMEEVDLLPTMLRALGYSPRETEFDAVSIWFFRPRVMFLYRHRGANLRQIIGAPAFDIGRMGAEIIAYLATRWSPTGEGAIFEKLRRDRNVFPFQPNSEPWLDNLPSAWEG